MQRENEKRVLFSGVRASGNPTIGNYFGAIRNWVRLQDDYDCLFCLVDAHTITERQDPLELRRRSYDLLALYLACGIDPHKNLVFVQSHVPAHAQLTWVLNCFTYVGELNRMTQFKDKGASQGSMATAGLYDYPVLMAADILLYQAEIVPVGEDQTQHLELAREIARKFNARFGDVFVEPEAIVGEAARIMGLDGKAKMSKSLDNYIALLDEPDVIRKKLKTAFTVATRLRKSDPGDPSICNIFTLHKFFTPADKCDEICGQCKSAELGCVDCKKMLADNMIAALAPIREKALAVRADEGYLDGVLKQGAEHCQDMAAETMAEVLEAMGLR